jgi:hypothetical protein
MQDRKGKNQRKAKKKNGKGGNKNKEEKEEQNEDWLSSAGFHSLGRILGQTRFCG